MPAYFVCAHIELFDNVRFGSKADMCSALGDVRIVPIADIFSLVAHRPFIYKGT